MYHEKHKENIRFLETKLEGRYYFTKQLINFTIFKDDRIYFET